MSTQTRKNGSRLTGADVIENGAAAAACPMPGARAGRPGRVVVIGGGFAGGTLRARPKGARCAYQLQAGRGRAAPSSPERSVNPRDRRPLARASAQQFGYTRAAAGRHHHCVLDGFRVDPERRRAHARRRQPPRLRTVVLRRASIFAGDRHARLR